MAGAAAAAAAAADADASSSPHRPFLERQDASASQIQACADPESSAIRRTGTVWTAVAYIITAVIGSGVLSLAWSVAQLGWVGGPLAILLFGGVTVVQSRLIADCYLCSHTDHRPVICFSYLDAVRHYLGERSHWLCAFIVQLNLYGNGVVYTITTATSIKAIRKLACSGDQQCSVGDGDAGRTDMLLFGAAQLLLSLIPHFRDMTWLSVFAAVMSFSYSFIGFGLGVARVIANGVIKGAAGGIAASSATDKAWRVSQAIGDIAFALPFSLVLLEIEDTLKPPPADTMKKAAAASVVITSAFYIGCGFFGYAAFGDDTPGNLLSGPGFEPRWLVGFANACVVLHLLGGYQVYCQPVYGHFDRWLVRRWPESAMVAPLQVKLPLLPAVRVSAARLCFRTFYVVTTTALAIYFPYFNEVIGLAGSFTFWPLTIHFPVEMYLVHSGAKRWSALWTALRAFSGVCLAVGAFAFVGSLEGVLSEKATVS